MLINDVIDDVQNAEYYMNLMRPKFVKNFKPRARNTITKKTAFYMEADETFEISDTSDSESDDQASNNSAS